MAEGHNPCGPELQCASGRDPGLDGQLVGGVGTANDFGCRSGRVENRIGVDGKAAARNPGDVGRILDGQIHGGVAMGIGNAYYEKLVYDESGQLLNASFAGYLIPTASEVPRIEIGHEETPSPLNPLGSKGAGEAGAIPVPALFAQALENALPEYDLEILETPLSPNRLYELLMDKESKS